MVWHEPAIIILKWNRPKLSLIVNYVKNELYTIQIYCLYFFAGKYKLNSPFKGFVTKSNDLNIN